MRASRLLTLLLLLQNRGGLTADELAAELEVSVRTVYRDIDALSSAGVPVYGERGRSGGYRLLEGYRTRLTGLNETEAQALLFSGMPGPAAELGLGAAMAAAQLKLRAALPSGLRDSVDRIRECFLLDTSGWFQEPDSVPYLAELASAVWSKRRVWMRYRRWGPAEVEREVDPLGLVLKATKWYFVGNTDRGLRAYRVSRIQELTVLDADFERPAEFDLPAFWRHRVAELSHNLYSQRAVVRLSPRARELLFLLGPAAAAAVEDTAGKPDGDGWVRAQLPIESIQHGFHDLLRFGAEVEVLEPSELRRSVVDAVARMSELYG